MFLQATKRAKEAEPYFAGRGGRRGSPADDAAGGLLHRAEAPRRGGAPARAARHGSPRRQPREHAARGDRAGRRAAAKKRSRSSTARWRSSPTTRATLAAKSELLRQQNRLDEAAKVADRAVAANPQSAEAQFAKGRVLRAQGSYDKAEAAFKHVLQLNPRAGAARVELARLRIRSGADDAVAVATDAANAEPASVEAKLVLVRALLQRREFAKAEAALDGLMRTAPSVAAVHTQMGVLRAMRHDMAGARAAFSRALELDSIEPRSDHWA